MTSHSIISILEHRNYYHGWREMWICFIMDQVSAFGSVPNRFSIFVSLFKEAFSSPGFLFSTVVKIMHPKAEGGVP